MKFLSSILLFGAIFHFSLAFADTDSLKNVLKSQKGEDRLLTLNELAYKLAQKEPEEAEEYNTEAKEIQEKVQSKKGEMGLIRYDMKVMLNLGDFSAAYEKAEIGLKLAHDIKDNDFAKKFLKNRVDIALKGALEDHLEAAFTDILNYANKTKDIGLEAYYHEKKGAQSYYIGDYPTALSKWQLSADLYKESGDRSKFAGMNMNIGIIQYRTGLLEESLDSYDYALKEFQIEKDTQNIANALVNIAMTHHEMGNYKNALSYFESADPLYATMNSQSGLAINYENMASTYHALGKYSEAFDLYNKALRIKEELNDLRGLGITYINMASIYGEINDTINEMVYIEKAIGSFEDMDNLYMLQHAKVIKAQFLTDRKEYAESIEMLDDIIRIQDSIQDYPGLGSSYISLGNNYQKLEQPQKALDAYQSALEIKQAYADQAAIAGITNNIGVIYFDLKQYRKSIEYYKIALETRLSLGEPKAIYESYLTLSNSYKELGDYRNAYDNLVLHNSVKDSVFNEDMKSSIAEMEAQYHNLKTQDSLDMALMDAELLHKENERVEAESSKKSYFLIGSIIIIGAFVVLVALMIRIIRQKKKTNNLLNDKNIEITTQKHLVEEKNREIVDSITYAKRLQEAILPPLKAVEEQFKESFIMYKPKDIVAGDFYWMETKISDGQNEIYFAAADCTGHGVPGAMVSVVCSNALNRVVTEMKVDDPGKILDKVTDLVIDTFEKSEDEVKDGMDIALCKLNGDDVLSFSGANNPLYIIRESGEELIVDGEKVEAVEENGSRVLFELKGNKQPVGQFENRKEFNSRNIQLKEGDAIYLFTDGFADQFGGENGKKFKYKQFKRYLLEVFAEPMKSQKSLIENKFSDWMGSFEQIDDVCVIGVRV